MNIPPWSLLIHNNHQQIRAHSLYDKLFGLQKLKKLNPTMLLMHISGEILFSKGLFSLYFSNHVPLQIHNDSRVMWKSYYRRKMERIMAVMPRFSSWCSLLSETWNGKFIELRWPASQEWRVKTAEGGAATQILGPFCSLDTGAHYVEALFIIRERKKLTANDD